MKLIRLLTFLALFSFAAPSTEAEAPLEAYGQLPDVSLATLSPSGNRAALLRNDGGKSVVVVYDLATKEMISGVEIGDLKPRDLTFANDDKLIVKVGKTTRLRFARDRFEYSAAFILDVNTTDVRQLLRRADDLYPAQEGLGRIVGRSPDGSSIYMPAFNQKRSGADPQFGIYKVRLDKRLERVSETGSHHARDWFVDEHGEPIAREDFDNALNRHRIWSYSDGKRKLIHEEETEIPRFSLEGLSPDRESLIIAAYSEETGRLSFYTMSLADGSVDGPIMGRDDAGVEQVLHDLNRVVYGVRYSGFYPSYEFFDDALTKRMQAEIARFPGTAVSLVSWSDDFSTLLLHISGGWHSGGYLLVREGEEKPVMIAQDRSAIPGDLVVPTIVTEYKARDGLVIPALLTVQPAAIGKGRVPLIVLPHGGPESYDRFRFDWLPQYFASRGYAVLQPQFRGSDGFGIEFRLAGRGEWGGKMQSDLDDGVAFLVDEGVADPDRICIVGASYGGYAALAGGAFSPELYRCVVSINGVSDLQRMIKTESRQYGRNHWVVSYWERLYGTDRFDDEKLDAISPAKHAESFQAPVLLVHGKKDTVVPVEQSRHMRKMLRGAGKEVTLVELDGEDHYLSFGESRLEALMAISEFIEKHL